MTETKVLPEWLKDPKLKRYDVGQFWVEYSIFNSDVPPGLVSAELQQEFINKHDKLSHVCFSGLPDKARNVKNGNRLIFHLEIDEPVYKQLTDDERTGWIRILKQHGMLPNYVPENAVVKKEPTTRGTSYSARQVVAEGYYMFDITDINQSLLYLYLTMVRNLREAYGIPIVTQFLASKGMDLYAALGFGHNYGSGGSGHAMLSISNRSYTYNSRGSYVYQSKNHPESIISLNVLNGLARYMRDPKHFDSKSLTTGGYWKCYPIIDLINASKKQVAIDIVDAFNEHIVKAIHAEDDNSYDEHIEAFMADAKREASRVLSITKETNAAVPSPVAKIPAKIIPKPIAVNAQPPIKAWERKVAKPRKNKVGFYEKMP